ncbi:MAG: hypothetical protein NZ937_09990 [Armatimonadetes bacterium]|nr:hypothetical protein [Armatimonadota bacterium]MDW8027950.1 hypothetical protein [Armatimonadota bacterium]
MKRDFVAYLILLGAIVHDALVDAPSGAEITLKLPDGGERCLIGSDVVPTDSVKPSSQLKKST